MRISSIQPNYVRNVNNSFTGLKFFSRKNPGHVSTPDMTQKPDEAVFSCYNIADAIEKGNEIKQRANDISKDAKVLLQESKEEYDKVLSVLDDQYDLDFISTVDEEKGFIRRFIKDGYCDIMEEVQDGKLVRRTTFYPAALKIFKIEKDIEKGQNNTEKIKRIYNFDDGGCWLCEQNAVYAPDKSSKQEKRFYFNKGELVCYDEGVKKDADGSIHSDEEFKFEYGQLKNYDKENYLTEDNDTAKERYNFKDGELTTIENNVKAWYSI